MILVVALASLLAFIANGLESQLETGNHHLHGRNSTGCTRAICYVIKVPWATSNIATPEKRNAKIMFQEWPCKACPSP